RRHAPAAPRPVRAVTVWRRHINCSSISWHSEAPRIMNFPAQTSPLETDQPMTPRATSSPRAAGVVGQDPIACAEVSRRLMELARRVAGSECTVLVAGESGTGKEVLARYIHRHSVRAPRPFVAVNCAAIPDHLLEGLLFGWERGAFTGAQAAH